MNKLNDCVLMVLPDNCHDGYVRELANSGIKLRLVSFNYEKTKTSIFDFIEKLEGLYKLDFKRPKEIFRIKKGFYPDVVVLFDILDNDNITRQEVFNSVKNLERNIKLLKVILEEGEEILPINKIIFFKVYNTDSDNFDVDRKISSYFYTHRNMSYLLEKIIKDSGLNFKIIKIKNKSNHEDFSKVLLKTIVDEVDINNTINIGDFNYYLNPIYKFTPFVHKYNEFIKFRTNSLKLSPNPFFNDYFDGNNLKNNFLFLKFIFASGFSLTLASCILRRLVY